MIEVILITVAVLGTIGLVAALVLFIIAKLFTVKEDPRIAQVNELLPGANCGGCGFPGCSGMAVACVKAADEGSLEDLKCPAGGNECMKQIAALLGVEAKEHAAKVAVIRCNGTCENRPHVIKYDGALNCRIAHSTCQGETLCQYGCLGCGDCVSACSFGAIKMNTETGLPEVDYDKCGGCGSCAKSCPRNIIEIRLVDKDKTGMVVECVNKDKGAVAKKACLTACIGCGKCAQVCGSDAITIENNLAYIDVEKCTLCRACEEACPSASIIMLGKPRKEIKKNNATAKKADSNTNTVKEIKTTNVRPYSSPIKISFEAPLLPSQQYLLAGVVDLTPIAQATVSDNQQNSKTHSYDAPLLPSQQILLGK